MAHDPKKPEPAHHAGSAHGTTGATHAIDQIQASLDDLKAQFAEAMPEIESEAAKARRQLERISAAQAKWKLTHEPDDPFDPSQFEPPMVPLKQDAAKQRNFHSLHYRIAKAESELGAAIKAAAGGEATSAAK